MVDIKQLRVGNFVLDGQSVVEVAEILSDSINTLQCEGIPFGEVEPILISTEILELCGFEWETTKKTHCQISTLGDSLLIFYCIDGKIDQIQFSDKHSWEWYSYPVTYFQFLHQIQNIYFAMSNTELKIDIDNLKSVLK